jgi:hypothetical protein
MYIYATITNKVNKVILVKWQDTLHITMDGKDSQFGELPSFMYPLVKGLLRESTTREALMVLIEELIALCTVEDDDND